MMKPSSKDKAEGNFHEVQGKVKAKAGQLTSNRGLAAEATDVVFLVMNPEGMKTLVQDSVKLGAGLSVAASRWAVPRKAPPTLNSMRRF